MMKVEYDSYAKKNVPRKYFAGGVFGGNISSVLKTTSSPAGLKRFLKMTTLVALTVGFSLFAGNLKRQTATPAGQLSVDSLYKYRLATRLSLIESLTRDKISIKA